MNIILTVLMIITGIIVIKTVISGEEKSHFKYSLYMGIIGIIVLFLNLPTIDIYEPGFIHTNPFYIVVNRPELIITLIFNGIINFIASLIAFKFSANTTNTTLGYFIKYIIIFVVIFGILSIATTFVSSLF